MVHTLYSYTVLELLLLTQSFLVSQVGVHCIIEFFLLLLSVAVWFPVQKECGVQLHRGGGEGAGGDQQ